MKRIVISGGAGFIGSHLCERLLREGHNVVCLDNYFTGCRENIEHLLDDPNFELVEHDLIDPYHTEADEIYNLACPASPVYYQHDPIKTIKTSVLGAIHMLGMAKRNGARILQASTSEVYGDPQVHPQPESACYDEGKRCAESLFFSYRMQHGLNVKIIRIFNTYGPKMNLEDGRVVSNFIVQALLGRPITIYGDGSQTRSFQYVDDLIEGMVRMMASPDDFLGPVNIGNPGEFTMLELAGLVIGLTGSGSHIEFKPLPEDDPHQRRPDITLAREHLGGWQPTVQLEEGLRKTIAYFEELLRKHGVRA